MKRTSKQGQIVIGKQFEYNTYIRDFFADNKGASLDDAIRCWKYKKSLKGQNKYERIILRVVAWNKRAISLYEKNGFEIVGKA